MNSNSMEYFEKQQKKLENKKNIFTILMLEKCEKINFTLQAFIGVYFEIRFFFKYSFE
jgi:hypothetical protein